MSLKDKLYPVVNGTKLGHAVLDARRNLRNTDDSMRAIAESKYDFTDRSKGCDKLCIILAGYKEPLWDTVFGRLSAALPGDVDVCIMTSGLVNPDLQQLCQKQGWSYLSTEVNHLSHIQNVAIELHPNAKWIYKLDEDMFLPVNFFGSLMETYVAVDKDSFYKPAFVSPLINVSCYGHLRLLEKCDLVQDFAATGLTEMKFTDGLHHNSSALKDPAVAKYLWGATQPVLRDVDALTARFSAEPLSYSICPIRYNIGAILFERTFWEEFGKFPLTCIGSKFGLGDDEEHICKYALMSGRAMVVSENIVVGHLGYGPQTSAMIDYYKKFPERFELKK